MSQSQEVVVERLIMLIQRIQHERMTGMLTVKRGDGIAYEEGTVAFTNGQITQTKVGPHNGLHALNALSTWSNCSCTFDSPNGAQALLFPSSLRAPTPIQASPIPQTMLTAERPISPLRRLPTQQAPPVLPRTPRVQPVTPTPATKVVTEPLENKPIPPTQLLPYHTYPVKEALRIIGYLGLSRVHRHLFLLIDNHRALPELARLLHCPEYKVLALLRDLENAAVIHLSAPQS